MINPVFLSKGLNLQITKNTIETTTKIKESINAVGSTVIGFNTEEIPRIQKILNKFEPMTFPMAISFSFFLAATKEVTSSGHEVPIATIVNPIKVSLKPMIRARLVAPSTTN